MGKAMTNDDLANRVAKLEVLAESTTALQKRTPLSAATAATSAVAAANAAAEAKAAAAAIRALQPSSCPIERQAGMEDLDMNQPSC